MGLEALEAELREVESQGRALAIRANEIRQTILGLKAPHKIGDTIEWGKPGKEYRGVIRGFQSWVCNDVTYIVERRRKDGSTGATVKVYPYEKPRPSSVAWLSETVSPQ